MALLFCVCECKDWLSSVFFCVLMQLKDGDFHNNLFRRAVQNFLNRSSDIMDSEKTCDPELNPGKTSNILQFLDQKQILRSPDCVSVFSTDMETNQQKPSALLPQFSFLFQSFSIIDHVEYNVILLEKYKILGRTIVNRYPFKTRYSLLEVLNRKVGATGFPGKKLFGNKDPQFVERRKAELEIYLNRVAKSGKTEFYKFVKQIKDSEFNLSLKKDFSIE